MVKIDSACSAAYEDVRNDKSETNWLLMGYPDDKKDELALMGSGSGGLEEFGKQLKAGEAAFGYIRCVIGNDELSQRAKFVLVSWCGSEVKVMRKAKLSVHIADVKNVLKAFAIEVNATAPEDLNQKDIDLWLKKAMGANYDRQASAY